MRWLKKNDEGAVAIVVAVMLIVLFGLGALVVDVGNLYWERRELQRGADAAAMAGAQELVMTGSESDAYEEARFYANENNSRGAHVAPSDFETTPTSVRVTARTGSYDGPGQLSSILAGVLGVDEYATFATAAVRIDQNVGGGKTIPITICVENWNMWTNSGEDLPSGPPPHVISFADAPAHQDVENADCGNPGSSWGETYPGGFGFLNRDSECMAVTTADGIFDGKPGNNLNDPSSSCSADDVIDMLRSIIDNDELVLIPIFYDYQGNGVDGQFKVIGYGAFKLEGFKFLSAGGGIATTYPNPSPFGTNWNSVCSNPKSCLVGYYDRFVTLDEAYAGGGAEDYGARVAEFIE